MKNKKKDYGDVRAVSGYAWAVLVVSADEVGTRLGLTRSYAKHLPMVREYLDMQRDGCKVTYAYHHLADKYAMHPDSVKRIITRMLRTVRL